MLVVTSQASQPGLADTTHSLIWLFAGYDVTERAGGALETNQDVVLVSLDSLPRAEQERWLRYFLIKKC